MAKEFVIKALDKQTFPQEIASEFGNKKGLGSFKNWELWEINYDRALYSRGPWYLAIKDDLCICDSTFTTVLEYIDKDTQVSV